MSMSENQRREMIAQATLERNQKLQSLIDDRVQEIIKSHRSSRTTNDALKYAIELNLRCFQIDLQLLFTEYHSKLDNIQVLYNESFIYNEND